MTDLDGTLVFVAAPGPELREVERFTSGRVARIHRAAAAGWQVLASSEQLVVSTSRTVEQYQHADLPGAPYVLASNGLDLINHGVLDLEWRDHRTAALADQAEPWSDVGPIAMGLIEPGAFRESVIHQYFVVLVGLRDAVAVAASRLKPALAALNWRAVPVGRKLYLFPDSVDKQRAVALLLDRLDAAGYLAAGDSAMDHDLLAGADWCVVPRGSDLAEFPLDNMTVTTADGPQAGEAIVAWFRATCG